MAYTYSADRRKVALAEIFLSNMMYGRSAGSPFLQRITTCMRVRMIGNCVPYTSSNVTYAKYEYELPPTINVHEANLFIYSRYIIYHTHYAD